MPETLTVVWIIFVPPVPGIFHAPFSERLCNIADRCAEGELILDPQSVLPDFLCLISPGKQGHILSGVKQIPCQIAP
jgi:hypothetical protein